MFSETTVAVPPGSTAAPAVPGTTAIAGTTGKLRRYWEILVYFVVLYSISKKQRA